jgi:hypothetical protein
MANLRTVSGPFLNREKPKMITTRRLAALTTLTWLALGAGAKGDLIYNIVDYPNITNPYTVSGTITTNGATGTSLPSTDITGWDITVKQGNILIFELNSSNAGNIAGPFDATNTNINVGTRGDQIGVSDQTSEILWSSPRGLFLGYEGFTQSLGVTWDGRLPDPSSPIATVTAVPEPSTFVPAVLGAGSAIAFGLVRNRREQRRQAAA